MTVGFPHRPFIDREGRFGPRHSALAFDGGYEGCFFTADKGACTQFYLYIKIEFCPQDIFPQEIFLLWPVLRRF